MTRKIKYWDYGPGRRFWGHDYFISRSSDGGAKVFLSGFGRGIQAGDYMLLEHPDHVHQLPYRIVDVNYETDPRDMFWANLEWDYDGLVALGDDIEEGKFSWL